MSEPKYDEDIVNLGYFRKFISTEVKEGEQSNISKHYGTTPQPPYYAGDTWTNGSIVYTCINSRLIGTYEASDWVTESGAMEEAESKNKIFLTQPTNYSVGDMWILQSDDDHEAGKRGEILIATFSRQEYDEGDWVGMLDYGTIRSTNEIANNLNDALERLGIAKESGVVTIFYSDEIPEDAIEDDLWYLTGEVEGYEEGKVYKYTVIEPEENLEENIEEVEEQYEWVLVESNVVVVFEEANQPKLIEDGKIQSFYSDTEPLEDMDNGDIWKDTDTNRLYRYNGTNWVAIYDNNISEVRKSIQQLQENDTLQNELIQDLIQRVEALERRE